MGSASKHAQVIHNPEIHVPDFFHLSKFSSSWVNSGHAQKSHMNKSWIPNPQPRNHNLFLYPLSCFASVEIF